MRTGERIGIATVVIVLALYASVAVSPLMLLCLLLAIIVLLPAGVA